MSPLKRSVERWLTPPNLALPPSSPTTRNHVSTKFAICCRCSHRTTLKIRRRLSRQMILNACAQNSTRSSLTARACPMTWQRSSHRSSTTANSWSTSRIGRNRSSVVLLVSTARRSALSATSQWCSPACLISSHQRKRHGSCAHATRSTSRYSSLSMCQGSSPVSTKSMKALFATGPSCCMRSAKRPFLESRSSLVRRTAERMS